MEKEIELEKYKKAFEIIKEKLDLGLDLRGSTNLLTYYCENECCYFDIEITEEENNILKEVL